MIFIDFPAATAPVDKRAGTRRLAEALQKRIAEREASKPMISRDWQIMANYSIFLGKPFQFLDKI